MRSDSRYSCFRPEWTPGPPALSRVVPPAFSRAHSRTFRWIAACTVLAGLFAGAAGCSTSERETQMEKKAGVAAVDGMRLSRGARQALSAYDPRFFVTGCRDTAFIEAGDQAGQAPPTFTVEGDFNGDGATDLAVLGMTESHRALLALFCAGENCSVMEVERWPRTRRGGCEGRLYLTPETPGMKRSAREARPLRLRNDAVRIYYDQAAQAILYYQNDGFNSFIMHN